MNNQQHRYKVEEVKIKHKFPFLQILLVLIILIIITLFTLVGYKMGFNKGSKNPPIATPSTFTNSTTATITKSPFPSSNLTLQPSIRLSPTPTPLPKSLVLNSEKKLDGYATSVKTTSADAEIKIGRNKYLVSSGFLSFDITNIPQKAKLISALLRIYQVRTIGNPYINNGNIKLDHLNYGDALDGVDYFVPALAENYGTLSKTKETGWREIDVTLLIKNDSQESRTKSQYRLRFDKNEKGETESGDFVYFESSDNSEGTGNVPQLIVKYY